MEEALQRIHCTTHSCFVSESVTPRAGGVATLVPKHPSVRAVGKSFVAGRVLLVTIHNSEVDFTIYHWNVHNFAINADGLKEIQACVQSQLRRVRDDPMKFT
eukprot:2563394-Pyramimonas_sp.AAC.1